MFAHLSTTVFLAIIVSLWTTLYFYFRRNFNYWKDRKVPYLPPMLLFGNAFEVFTFRRNIGEMARKIYESTTKPFIGFFICDEPYLLIRDPELVKSVLVKDFALFSNRSVSDNKEVDPMGSHLLFILKTPDWRDMRRKISPVFSSAKLKVMYDLIHEAGVEMINYLDQKVEQNPVVEIRDITGKYTTEAITSTSFGINSNCFKNEDAEFRKVSQRVLNWSIWERAISTSCYFVAPNLVKWFKLKFVDTASADFLRNAFWKTMIEREKTKFVRNDLLDILIEIKNQEDIDDPYKLEGDKLVAQATQFFLAGFETTSSAICFTLYELARHPEIQDKVRKEVQATLKKHGKITYNALKEMEYLEMCVKEALRKYPVLSFLDRRCSSDYQIPGTDVVLKKGTAVFISGWGLHYDSNYYPNPEVYDPMRFTEENMKTRPEYTFLAFGSGPRNCIGARFAYASLKSSLAAIISRYEIEFCEKTKDPLIIDPKGFLLAPISDLYLKFKKYDKM
ncbi:hypothetical protein Zmor_013929 [Zophobas morio]|uniref:Cytochrome P450 n=2 Tax=Zophobas morio TaxID=2755281 RepID=A0AA38IIK3_9CUCU|nr:hypothetical protein Zmor_013929 [Zophobas morio]